MAKYKDAIDWIVYEDDTDFLDDENGSPSVTACMVSDLFKKEIEEVIEDIRVGRDKMRKKSRARLYTY